MPGKPEKLGLYGGSFDPFHVGHLRPVRRAREALGLDRVLYLPTAEPPHKQDRWQAPGPVRYAMVELALLDEAGLYASAHELTPGKVSYTVQTLEDFQRDRPGTDLHLLIGGDSFLDLERWFQWERIIELARLVILPRPGFGVGALVDRASPPLRRLLDSGRAVEIDEPTLIDISSTEIKRQIRQGETGYRSLIPDLVLEYMDKYELYR